MKKIAIIISLLTITFSGISQEGKRHELKLDALGALVVPSLEITYEYTMNAHSALGVSSFFRLDAPDDDYEAFTLAPYYRQYFYDNRAYGNKGFFIEALLQYSNGKSEELIVDEDRDITGVETYNDIGIGFGGGVKWITFNGFTVEAGAALGRNFKWDANSPDFFFRWGINLGYRFF